MRAAGIDELGNTVHPIVLPEPRAPAPDEVLIDVIAAGVGNWDEFVRTGGWDVGAHPPMALGVEASGVIASVGDAVTGWSIGEAVMTHPLPLRDQGAWSARMIAPAELLAPKPESASWELAAAFPVPALTALQALTEGVELQSGDCLLVSGAGGVTGRLLVQLARLQGARVIATAGPDSADALAPLGLDAVLDYHDAGWPRTVRELTGGAGVTAAVNAAPNSERATLSTVADGGRLATITGSPPAPERGVSITNVYVRADGDQLRSLAPPLARHRLTITIGAVYELARAQEALTAASRGTAGGAVVLRT
jgi:NADPH:quinone reductase-like Zn-dependent oxidoreductase